MTDQNPQRQRTRWTAAGFATGVLLVLLLLLLLTQTRWGQARVLEFTLGFATGQVRGELTIERLRGNLLTGARLYDVRLVDPDDEPFLVADSVFVEYSLRTLIGGEVTLRRLRVFGAEVVLRRRPGEESWNYQRIFEPREEPDPDPSPTVLHAVELVGSTFYLEFPWEPYEGLGPEARRQEIEHALSNESRVVVREVPGGFLRTMEFAGLNGLFPRVQVGADEVGGTVLEVQRLTGRFHIWREPLRLEGMTGEVALARDRLEFQASPLLLPASRISAFGVVDLADEPPTVDVTFGGEEVALRDLQWLYPGLPDEGGGQLVLVIESREEGTLYFARDAEVTFPGNRIRGDFGIVIGEVIQFAGVDLHASPLDLGRIGEMLPAELPLENLEVGAARIRSHDR